MARLPTLDDLGARPTPVSRRGVASNPRAGAIGGALARIGDNLAQTGDRLISQQIEREDRLAYASAKSELLKADIVARKELETDPDYDTWEARYAERMKVARSEAAGRIKSSADRALFEQDAELSTLKGSADLAKGAYARRVDTEIASGKEKLFELQDLAQDAPDDAAREEVIANASDLIAGMQAKGYLGAEAAGNLRRDWTQGYIVQRIETLRTAEDYDGALKFFEANRGRLDQATESRVENLLIDAMNNRESLILAEEFVTGGQPATANAAGAVPVVPRARRPAERAVEMQLGGAGFSPAVVAGFLGNFEVEGGYGGKRGDGGTASGIAQWRKERRTNFRRRFGKEPHQATAEEQAEFVVWEMENPQAAGMTVAQRDAILAARTPEEAARLIDKYYERSSGEHRAKRETAAREYHGGTGGTAPQRRDLTEIYATIDARADEEGWTPEKTERVKSQATRLVQREDTLLDREQADAYEAALAKVEALGENFTEPSQIGDAYYRASEVQQRTIRNMAEANARAKEAGKTATANGGVVRALHRMAISFPGQFVTVDLRPYRPFMTPGEYDEISTSQARTQEEAGKWSPRTGIQGAIAWGENFGGVEIADDSDRYRVYRYIEGRARQFRTETKGKTPVEDDYQRWFREAAQTYTDKRAFEVLDAPGGITGPYRKQIIRNFRAVEGRDPNEAEIQQWFDRMGEAIK